MCLQVIIGLVRMQIIFNGVHHIDRLHGPNEAIDTVNNKHYTNGVEDTEAYNKDFN